jgi:hypothetical protein
MRSLIGLQKERLDMRETGEMPRSRSEAPIRDSTFLAQ